MIQMNFFSQWLPAALWSQYELSDLRVTAFGNRGVAGLWFAR